MNQLNFAFQYLGTLNLIQNSYSHERGIYDFNPTIITGKGIDIVETLMLDITTKIKNETFRLASATIDKISIFLVEVSQNPDLWNILMDIFHELIEKLMVIF